MTNQDRKWKLYDRPMEGFKTYLCGDQGIAIPDDLQEFIVRQAKINSYENVLEILHMTDFPEKHLREAISKLKQND